jgi:hypothetical protein
MVRAHDVKTDTLGCPECGVQGDISEAKDPVTDLVGVCATPECRVLAYLVRVLGSPRQVGP